MKEFLNKYKIALTLIFSLGIDLFLFSTPLFATPFPEDNTIIHHFIYNFFNNDIREIIFLSTSFLYLIFSTINLINLIKKSKNLTLYVIIISIIWLIVTPASMLDPRIRLTLDIGYYLILLFAIFLIIVYFYTKQNKVKKPTKAQQIAELQKRIEALEKKEQEK